MPLQAEGSAAVADPVLAEGELLALSLSRQGSTRPLDLVEAEDLLASTLAYWQHWIRKSRYRGRYREMVERSALALKLLVHQPTGALVAAADHLAARVRLAAAATGTTASPGSATRPSPSTR